MIGMNEISRYGVTEGEHALEEAIIASDQHEKRYQRIKQLLKESNEAKEKGQWKKAQGLLLELSKLTRV
jgi:predicted RNA-binding protein associated with RNAse of E/G family